jgi:MYXO-CTERM domain-containing protein
MMSTYGCGDRRFWRLVPALLAIGALFCASATATAGQLTTTYFFRIEADNGVDPIETFEVLVGDVPYDPGSQTWSWAGTGIPLGEVAVLNQANLTIEGDPRIAMGFALTAGERATTVAISSAILGFAAFSDPDGGATAGLTLTDNDGNGAMLTGLGFGGGGGGAYIASYNTPPGTVFAEFLPELEVVPPDGSASGGGGTGSVTIFDTVTSMQAQFSFELSGGDSASGSSNYLIIPEPASVVLLGLAGLLLRRRRG